MTRHVAYAVHADGRAYRHPFASFPHVDAARRWLQAHPDTPVRFVPELPALLPEDDDTLGPCGCTDYHLADCPTRTGGSYDSAESIWAAAERAQRRADYYGEDPEW